MSNCVDSEQGHSERSVVKTATGDANFEQGCRPVMETRGAVTKSCPLLAGVVNVPNGYLPN